ncbi:hypothetical protein [Anaerofustis stercorihominis]|uniref:hypothetical protein n=1 Tax=Anaerofustis stercorihominis TaxID=214853 RepID=UPI002671F461|nr:hypothetical protein [Anaerofustis stercorihominis]
MKKQDLNNGDIVQLRDGEKYIVLKNTKASYGYDDLLINLKSGLNCTLSFMMIIYIGLIVISQKPI